MRGWQHCGRVFDAGFMLDAATVREDDILIVTPFVDRPVMFRCGSIRARDTVGLGWHSAQSCIPAIAHGDHVYRATAIGEDAFKRPSDTLAPD